MEARERETTLPRRRSCWGFHENCSVWGCTKWKSSGSITTSWCQMCDRKTVNAALSSFWAARLLSRCCFWEPTRSPKPIFLAQVLFLARPKAGNNTHKHKLMACWAFVEEFHRARTYAMRRGEKCQRKLELERLVAIKHFVAVPRWHQPMCECDVRIIICTRMIHFWLWSLSLWLALKNAARLPL